MHKMSLIILEANETERKSMTEFFSKCEEVELLDSAGDGKEGCDKITRHKPDAIIMDVVLPVYDGFAVLEMLLKLGKRPVTICFSAFSKESIINKAINMGADYYMVKPCDYSLLKDRLVEMFWLTKPLSGRNIVPMENKAKLPERRIVSKSLDERITNIFISIGIPPHIKGYSFLREAVKLAVDEPEIINSITKRLYPSIAGRFDTSASKVERAIRHAIEVAWNRGKMENVNSLFGVKVYGNNDKPTNGEFIALIADKMLLEGA
jgi:two-component system response regulator (stage 0 sporulation protein A)